jgi:hypothetical protein
MKNILRQCYIASLIILMFSCSSDEQDVYEVSNSRLPSMTAHFKTSNASDGGWEILLFITNHSDKEITIPDNDPAGNLMNFHWYDEKGSWSCSGNSLTAPVKIPAGNTAELQLIGKNNPIPFLGPSDKYTVKAIYFGLGIADDSSIALVGQDSITGRPDIEYGCRMMEVEVSIPKDDVADNAGLFARPYAGSFTYPVEERDQEKRERLYERMSMIVFNNYSNIQHSDLSNKDKEYWAKKGASLAFYYWVTTRKGGIRRSEEVECGIEAFYEAAVNYKRTSGFDDPLGRRELIDRGVTNMQVNVVGFDMTDKEYDQCVIEFQGYLEEVLKRLKDRSGDNPDAEK